MHSLIPSYLDQLTFRPPQMAALAALGEARGRQVLYAHQRAETLDSLKQTAIIESSESSNRIEGVLAPRERIEALVLRPTEPQNRSEQEIAGYRTALGTIHESYAHMPFSINILLQLHSMLYRYHSQPGGRFKATDNEIIERAPDGELLRVRFRPTTAVETQPVTEKLIARYRNAVERTDFPTLVTIPLTILDFLCIHPFTDGNGRVGRLVTLMLLYQHGFEVGRYISLERIIEESKVDYYEALEKSSIGWHEGKHDPHPWLNYFWGTIQRAYNEFEERVGSLTSPAGKSEQVRAAVLRRIGPFAMADIERECAGISHDLIRLVMRQMRDAGELSLLGRGRSAKWLRTSF